MSSASLANLCLTPDIYWDLNGGRQFPGVCISPGHLFTICLSSSSRLRSTQRESLIDTWLNVNNPDLFCRPMWLNETATHNVKWTIGYNCIAKYIIHILTKWYINTTDYLIYFCKSIYMDKNDIMHAMKVNILLQNSYILVIHCRQYGFMFLQHKSWLFLCHLQQRSTKEMISFCPFITVILLKACDWGSSNCEFSPMYSQNGLIMSQIGLNLAQYRITKMHRICPCDEMHLLWLILI